MMNLKEAKMVEGKEPLTRRERGNRNMYIACMLLGAVIGMVLAMVNPDKSFAAFTNDPVPPILAGILAAIWGIGLPLMTIVWNRYLDEQEAHAYRTGAYYAFMLYGIGAPVWWILWRGGLVPEPNGVIIYYATVMTCGIIWLRMKYA